MAKNKATKIWVPERALKFDPRYAYLHIKSDSEKRQGIAVHMNKIYVGRKAINSKIALHTFFSLEKFGTWEECVIEAKKYRNKSCEQILGDQFMRYGSMPKVKLSKANTSGYIGVHENEAGAFEAYWLERVDSRRLDISPKYYATERMKRSKSFSPDGHTAAARDRAFQAACEYRDRMIAIHYPAIETVRDFVLNDTAAEHDTYVGTIALLNDVA